MRLLLLLAVLLSGCRSFVVVPLDQLRDPGDLVSETIRVTHPDNTRTVLVVDSSSPPLTVHGMRRGRSVTVDLRSVVLLEVRRFDGWKTTKYVALGAVGVVVVSALVVELLPYYFEFLFTL